MNLDDYRKVQEYKKFVLSQKKIIDLTGLKEWDVRRLYHFTIDDFNNYLESKGSGIDIYNEYIMNLLRTTPAIPDTNIYFKIKEDFPSFMVGETTFKKHMKKLRKETGYDRFRDSKTAIRDTPIPGEEAQVDFGQYKINDMYGKRRLLYFIVIVLRYSQLKYVYFSTKDFNTLLAIEAHKKAFKFFGGMPKYILYDQDKVFAVSENYGNLVLVKEFDIHRVR